MAWEEVGVVVRSPCHDRTWVGHMASATFADTPAGPLRVVKAWCTRYAMGVHEATDIRWCQDDSGWRIEARWEA